MFDFIQPESSGNSDEQKPNEFYFDSDKCDKIQKVYEYVRLLPIFLSFILLVKHMNAEQTMEMEPSDFDSRYIQLA